MADFRTSSGQRHVRGFHADSSGGKPTDSHRPVSGRNGNRDGMGRDGKGREDYHRATRKSAELMARAVQWAQVNLPNESRNRAVAAFLAERGRLKRDPSTDEVLTRLKAWGHDREAFIARFGQDSFDAERAWLEARGL